MKIKRLLFIFFLWFVFATMLGLTAMSMLISNGLEALGYIDKESVRFVFGIGLVTGMMLITFVNGLACFVYYSKKKIIEVK